MTKSIKKLSHKLKKEVNEKLDSFTLGNAKIRTLDRKYNAYAE